MTEPAPRSAWWAGLRQRKLVQWALAYLAGAWLVLQVLGLAADSYGWPRLVMRLGFGAAALGFLATLVLAWYHGQRGEQRLRGTEVLIFVVLLAVGGGLLWRIERADITAGAAAATSSTTAAGAASVDPRSVVPAKSIAVLPFENLSSDPDNAYFATGMQDEILTRLAGIRDLTVISRTSTRQYASRPPNLKQVAAQLGVATVLEGSVQKSGTAVRINVQLIDARRDAHLWAQSYERDLKDIFQVQHEVAETVAKALQAQLLPEESARVARVPTTNAKAYELYLRGRAHFYTAFDQNSSSPAPLNAAIDLYRRALALDPQFALAAADLARAHMHMYFVVADRSEARLSLARTAAERALTLQPNLGAAHFALGLYHYWGRRDYASALSQLHVARDGMPNNAEVELFLAAIARRQGKWRQAMAGFQRATVLDPRSPVTWIEHGYSYSLLRHYAEADRAYARAVAIDEGLAELQIARAEYAVPWKGDLAPLRAALAAAPGSARARQRFQLSWWSRDYAAAIRTGQTDTAANWTDVNNIALPRQLYLAWAQEAAGDRAVARSLYASVHRQATLASRERPDDADLHLGLAFAAAGLGQEADALRAARRAITLMPVSRDRLSGPAYLGWLAQLHVRLGNHQQAIELLQQLSAMPAGMTVSPALLKLDPAWDPLRGDPRFKALLRHAIGFPASTPDLRGGAEA